VIGGVGYTMAGQLIDLANTLPTYKSNLHAKIVSLRSSKDGPWNRATNTLRELSTELAKTEPAPAAGAPVPKPVGEPLPVEVVYTPGSALETLKTFIAPVAGPLGTAAIVAVLVIFILLGREDLRDRMIHLIGRGRLHVTTQAIDEAGGRVSRYLVAQCIVNVAFGIPAMFDDVLAPVLRLVDAEFRAGNLDDAVKKEMYRVIREVIDDLGEAEVAPKSAVSPPPANGAVNFLCLPRATKAMNSPRSCSRNCWPAAV